MQNSDALVLINRGVVLDDENRAYTQFTGFVRREDGLYERFEQAAFEMFQSGVGGGLLFL